MSVGNTGTADATGVSAQDVLPAGVTFVSADTGGSGAYSPASGIWTIGTVPRRHDLHPDDHSDASIRGPTTRP